METWKIIRLIFEVMLGVGGAIFLVLHFLKKSDDPARLVCKWVVTGIIVGFILLKLGPATQVSGGAFMVPFIAACGLVLGILWAPTVAGFFGGALGSLYDGGDVASEPCPLYSRAEALRKRGQFDQAMAAVLDQLDLFPHDVQGHLLLAEIQADNLGDHASAEATLERLISQKDHHPKNIALALNYLADWRVKKGDLEGARQAMERIISLFPDSEQSHKAAQRLAHLSPQADVIAAHYHQPIHLKVRARSSNPGGSTGSTPAEEEAMLPARERPLIERLLDQLELNPDDNEARERLASEYAHDETLYDLARGQLQRLVDQKHAPPRQVIRWLNLLADLEVKAGDTEAAGAALKKVAELFPNSALAENARKRLTVLALEFKGKQKSQAIKLGSYPKRFGLRETDL